MEAPEARIKRALTRCAPPASGPIRAGAYENARLEGQAGGSARIGTKVRYASACLA